MNRNAQLIADYRARQAKEGRRRRDVYATDAEFRAIKAFLKLRRGE